MEIEHGSITDHSKQYSGITDLSFENLILVRIRGSS